MKDNRGSEDKKQTPVSEAPRKSIKELAALHKAEAAKVAPASPEKKAPGLVKRVKTNGSNVVVPPKPEQQSQAAELPVASPVKSILTEEELASRRKNREALQKAMTAPAKAPAKKVIDTGLNKEAFLARKETIVAKIEAQLSGNRVEMRGQMKEAVRKAFAIEIKDVIRQQAAAQIQSAEVIDLSANSNNASVASPAATATASAVQARPATVLPFFAQNVPEARVQLMESVRGPRATGFALVTPEAAGTMRGSQGFAASSATKDVLTMDFCRRAVAVKLPAGFVVTVEMINETLDSFLEHARAFNYDFDKEEQLIDYATDISLLRCFLDYNPEIGSVVYAMFEAEMMDDLKKSIMVAVSPAVRDIVEARAVNADNAGFDGSVRDYVDQVKTVDLLLSGNEEALRNKFFGGVN